MYFLKDGISPLHIALDQDHNAVVKVLIDAGASVDTVEKTVSKCSHVIKSALM